MKVYYPGYYRVFRCIASACPDSCCKEWAVDVDPDSAAFYRALPGPLGDRLRQVLKDSEDGAYMEIDNGRCPMWRPDGLCRIQAEQGHDALCKVCREFPRISHDFGDFRELGLELSCPEAARLILTAQPAPMICEEIPGGELPEYDARWMTTLLGSRETALSFLDSNALPLPQTLAILLVYGCLVQSELDGGKSAELPNADTLQQLKRCALPGSMPDIFAFFRSLEILTPHWRSRLSGTSLHAACPESLRPFVRYAILRYWLQAVSDGDIACRVKFIVLSALLIGTLGGDVVQTAQQFSKEIENDPDNVDALLDACYTEAAFADARLLDLLLNIA